MRTLFIAGMILAFSSAASAQDIQGYLCISEGATSLILDKNSGILKRENRETEGDKFLILPKEVGSWYFSHPDIKWTVKRFGEEFPLYACGEFSQDTLECFSIIYGALVFNKKYLRFYIISPNIYFQDFSIGNPVMDTEIGTCTKL